MVMVIVVSLVKLRSRRGSRARVATASRNEAILDNMDIHAEKCLKVDITLSSRQVGQTQISVHTQTEG